MFISHEVIDVLQPNQFNDQSQVPILSVCVYMCMCVLQFLVPNTATVTIRSRKTWLGIFKTILLHWGRQSETQVFKTLRLQVEKSVCDDSPRTGATLHSVWVGNVGTQVFHWKNESGVTMFVLGFDEAGRMDGCTWFFPKLEVTVMVMVMVMAPSRKLLLLFLSLPAFGTWHMFIFLET